MLALAGSASVMLALPAVAAAAQVSPGSLDFGNVPVGTTSTQQVVTLTADCTTILNVPPPVCLSSLTDLVNVNPSTTGDFAVTTTCPAGLGPLSDGTSQSCPLNVTFTPASGGAQSGVLNTGTTGIGGFTPGPTVTLNGSGVAGVTSSGGSPGAPTTTTRKCKRHKKHHHSALSAKKRKCKKKRG